MCFIRNLFATIIAVTITYWIEGMSSLPRLHIRLLSVTGMGLKNMIILSAVLSFLLSVTTVPMLMYGKRARIWTEERRKKMTARQFGKRG